MNRDKLKAGLEAMHAQAQEARKAIHDSDDEPNYEHPDYRLWKNLLDVEYYCLEAISDLDS